jgi:23S rRNA (adenine2503-C2)-methyltransferase
MLLFKINKGFTRLNIDKFSFCRYSTNFCEISENTLIQYVENIGQPKYRAQQIRNWVYGKGAVSFDQIKDIPAPIRKQLSDHFTFRCLEVVSEQISKDGTRKRAYRLVVNSVK